MTLSSQSRIESRIESGSVSPILRSINEAISSDLDVHKTSEISDGVETAGNTKGRALRRGAYIFILIYGTKRDSEDIVKTYLCDSLYTAQIFSQILPKLHRTEQDARPVVVMTCGISGSGKSTFAKDIISRLPDFTRLSADAWMYENYGLYAIDYPAEKYGQYQDEAQKGIKDQLQHLLREKQKNVVLDLSFWNKAYREEYKAIVERGGGRWVLVFFDAEKAVLWRRITQRRAERDALEIRDKGRNGDSAFDVDEKTFEMYCAGFERPVGEGEIIISIV